MHKHDSKFIYYNFFRIESLDDKKKKVVWKKSIIKKQPSGPILQKEISSLVKVLFSSRATANACAPASSKGFLPKFKWRIDLFEENAGPSRRSIKRGEILDPRRERDCRMKRERKKKMYRRLNIKEKVLGGGQNSENCNAQVEQFVPKKKEKKRRFILQDSCDL